MMNVATRIFMNGSINGSDSGTCNMDDHNHSGPSGIEVWVFRAWGLEFRV